MNFIPHCSDTINDIAGYHQGLPRQACPFSGRTSGLVGSPAIGFNLSLYPSLPAPLPYLGRYFFTVDDYKHIEYFII
jgi:hypothetical protein